MSKPHLPLFWVGTFLSTVGTTVFLRKNSMKSPSSSKTPAGQWCCGSQPCVRDKPCSRRVTSASHHRGFDLGKPQHLPALQGAQTRLSPGMETSLCRSCPGAEHGADDTVEQRQRWLNSALCSNRNQSSGSSPAFPGGPTLHHQGQKALLSALEIFIHLSPLSAVWAECKHTTGMSWTKMHPPCSLKCQWMWELWTTPPEDFKDSTWVSMVILQSRPSISVC